MSRVQRIIALWASATSPRRIAKLARLLEIPVVQVC